MRFVTTNCLKENMFIKKNIYSKNGNILISEGMKLNSSYIDKIKKIGYTGIYIEDQISSDLVIKSIVNENLRMMTIQCVKEIFVNSYNKKNIPSKNINNLKFLIRNIVSELMKSKKLVVNMIDIKIYNDYSYYHSTNVAILSIIIGISLGFKKEDLCNLGIAAILQNIGEVFVARTLLNKNNKLTDLEYNQIKKHTELGYEYLKKYFEIPSKTYEAILQHHERFDGRGYPNSVQGKKISLYGRIISIADVYDALTSDRPYRKSLLPSEAIEYIMANGGSMFDTKLVKIFTKKVAPYPVGMCVELSNGFKGIVYENYEDAIIRPEIKIIKNENDEIVEPFMINLKDDKSYLNVTIVKICDS